MDVKKVLTRGLIRAFLVLIFVFGMVPVRSYSACAAQGIKIDKKHFPDKNFRAYIKEILDKDSDGTLSRKERLAVKEIYVQYLGIKSLEGIKYFNNLESLRCYSNKLTNLDLRKNKKIVSLWCSWNKLKNLDIRGCRKITGLACYDNQLKTLDLSDAKKLEDIDCSINQLRSLDLSGKKDLEVVWCWKNKIKKLDVSAAKKLYFLECAENPISSLDVSHNPELDMLDCHSTNIRSLDLSACDAMLQPWPAAVSICCYRCTKLKEVRLPEGIRQLESVQPREREGAADREVFSGCTALKNIYIPSENIETVYEGCFKGVPDSCIIRVPEGKIEAYRELFQKSGSLSEKIAFQAL